MGHNISPKTLNTGLKATKENFPCLRHFFKIEEPAITSPTIGNLTDSVGGVVAGNVTFQEVAGQKFIFQAAGVEPLVSGSFDDPTGKHIIMLVVGKLAANVINLGSPAGQGGTGRIGLLAGTGNAVVDDATNAATATLLTFSAIDTEASAVVFEQGTSVAAYRVNVDGTFVVNGTPDIVGVPAIPTLTNIDSVTRIGITAFQCFGIALFYFDEIPEDIDLACNFMREKWLTGEKTIWPAWKGVK